MRTKLLFHLIDYCNAHLADIAMYPYPDFSDQAKMVAMYRDTIDRATHHLRGYHTVGTPGSGCAMWSKTFTMQPDESCSAFADRVVRCS